MHEAIIDEKQWVKYAQLKDNNETSLWGGTSCKYIKDEQHLLNTISYIERHQPDNTKIEM